MADNSNLGLVKKIAVAGTLTLILNPTAAVIAAAYGVNELVKLLYHHQDSLLSYTKQAIPYVKKYISPTALDNRDTNIKDIDAIDHIDITETPTHHDNDALDKIKDLSNQAINLYQQGHYEEAEPLFKEALDKHIEKLGHDHPDTLTSMNNLAALYQAQGRYEEAAPLFKEVLDKSIEKLGHDHPDTLSSMNNLAALYQAQGRYEEAAPLFKEVLDKSIEKLGRDHPDTLSSMNNLAALYESQGRYKEAEPLLKEALVGMKKIYPADHPHIKTVQENLEYLQNKKK